MIEPCNVNCVTNDEAKELFEILRSHGYRWCDGDVLKDGDNRWNIYKYKTYYGIGLDVESISYGTTDYKKDFISLQEFKQKNNLDGWFHGWIKKPGVWAYAGQEKNNPFKTPIVQMILDVDSSTIGWWKFICEIVPPPAVIYEEWVPSTEIPEELYVGIERKKIFPAKICFTKDGVHVVDDNGTNWPKYAGFYKRK